MKTVREERASFVGAPAQAAKASINLRIDKDARALIDEAAAAQGKTRTEFMVDAARQRATDVLLERSLFALDSKQFQAFADALNAPSPPGAKLRNLLDRKPAWEN